MKTLAFDTSLGACTVVAAVGERVLAARGERRARGHAEALLPMIEEVRREAGLGYDAFDLVAATVGPGSFTGVRVGVAAARAIALAAGVRAVGIATTAALAERAAAEVPGLAPILAILDARRGEACAQLFDLENGRPIARWPLPIRDSFANAAAILDGEVGLLVGSGAGALNRLLPPSRAWRDAGLREPDGRALVLAALARLRQDPDAPPPTPIYMRPPDTNRPPASR